MEPTRNISKDMTQNNGEVNEQGSYRTMNVADVSDFCFEHEEYPSLKIVKVETIVDSEVSQNKKVFALSVQLLRLFLFRHSWYLPSNQK